jgi:hypothetical protein
MIKINEKESFYEIKKNESLENLIDEAKQLYNELNKENFQQENKNLIFKYLSILEFGQYIIPYLSLKEILNLRQASKEINILINSKFCCLNYYFKTLKNDIHLNNKNSIKIGKKSKNQLKPLEELNEESEFMEQKMILNDIKKYIKSSEFNIKHLSKIYKVEIDYLKYEESHHDRYMKSLNEIKGKIINEYKTIQKKGSINKNKLKEKKEENNEHNNFGINELKNKIEELKSKKDKILFKLNKEKKINEDLMKTNKEKKNIINKLKNIYFKDFDNKQNDEIEIDDLSGINILLNNS